MLTTIENAKQSLSKIWIVMPLFSVMAVALFVLIMFRDLPTNHLFNLMFVIAGIGFVAGMYLTFRSECGIASALFRLLYGLFVMEVMFGGGGAALAMHIASRLDLSWWAFYTNCIIAMLSLFVGMYREADTLELWGKDVAWRSKLKKYIDYSSQQLDPTGACQIFCVQEVMR